MPTQRRSHLKPLRGAHPMRIDRIKIENYRAVHSLELTELTPLTVLLGPNGSGKSTLFDVFSFLSECFTLGLRKAWDKRGRFKELRTRGSDGAIVFELSYRENAADAPAKYHLEIQEDEQGPFVANEWLQWRRVARNVAGAPFRILSFKNGSGWVISGEHPIEKAEKVRAKLDERELLAVSTLGRLKGNPRVAALRRFISNWYVSYLSAAEARGQAEAGAHEHLSKTGDNLANVIQFLKERHPQALDRVSALLRERVPRVDSVETDETRDGKLLLLIKDAPFKEPVLARFASDGTLKMLAYLLVLHDPDPPPFIGIEEPENFLHPRLLLELADECRTATERSQLFVTTHSPFFLNAMKAEEVRVLYRDERGYTQARRASDMPGIAAFMDAGATLGHLWMEGRFDVGDPLVHSGAPKEKRRR